MADKCGNCDCADRSQCTKNGNQFSAEIIETQPAVVTSFSASENDGKCCSNGCSCNAGCGCSSCNCCN